MRRSDWGQAVECPKCESISRQRATEPAQASAEPETFPGPQRTPRTPAFRPVVDRRCAPKPEWTFPAECSQDKAMWRGIAIALAIVRPAALLGYMKMVSSSEQAECGYTQSLGPDDRYPLAEVVGQTLYPKESH